jgi:polysaccharide biosynthesis/export protein
MMQRKSNFLAFAIVAASLLLTGIWSGAVSHAQVLQQRYRYTLLPGDKLDVKFRLTPEFDQSVIVQPDGFVQLDVAGDVKVAALTVEDAEKAIASSASKRLNDPEVSISLVTFQKPYYVVAGEVAKPGRFDMSDDTTAMQALLMAGGPTADGKVSEIIVFRRINGTNAQVKLLDLRNIKKTSDLERDCQLQPGDMLYVTRNWIARVTQITRIANSFGLYINPLQAAF